MTDLTELKRRAAALENEIILMENTDRLGWEGQEELRRKQSELTDARGRIRALGMTDDELVAALPDSHAEIEIARRNKNRLTSMIPVGDAARGLTLKATIERITRKAEIMRLDAPTATAKGDAEEIRLLAGIAMRCIGEDAR